MVPSRAMRRRLVARLFRPGSPRGGSVNEGICETGTSGGRNSHAGSPLGAAAAMLRGAISTLSSIMRARTGTQSHSSGAEEIGPRGHHWNRDKRTVHLVAPPHSWIVVAGRRRVDLPQTVERRLEFQWRQVSATGRNEERRRGLCRTTGGCQMPFPHRIVGTRLERAAPGSSDPVRGRSCQGNTQTAGNATGPPRISIFDSCRRPGVRDSDSGSPIAASALLQALRATAAPSPETILDG